MSNDNDPRDDAMREIEAALDEFADRYREQWMARSYDPGDARRAGEASDKLLALIRSKLPQPTSTQPSPKSGESADVSTEAAQKDAEHEEIEQARSEPVRPYGEVRAEVLEGYAQIDRGEPIDKPRSLLEGHGIGAGIDHRDPGAWGEDDDRSRANEEHERAVEAWEFEATNIALYCGIARDLVLRMRDEGVRLMRARPASGKDEAAGELLRAAKAAIIKEADNADEGYSAGLHRAAEILDEAAERAGIKP